MSWDSQITIKSKHEIELMAEAGRINAEALAAAHAILAPGVTTADINAAAEDVLKKYDVFSPFKNYPGPYPYPASTCVSVNEELVHGIPSPKRKLAVGDIVSVDCGTLLDGYVADSAYSAGVGETSPAAKKLLEVTNADTLVVYYDGASKGVREIEALGNVVVWQEGRIALANKAVYHSSDERIVLTGDPRVIENENQVGGERITLFMRDERSIIEGGKVLFYQDKVEDSKLKSPLRKGK